MLSMGKNIIYTAITFILHNIPIVYPCSLLLTPLLSLPLVRYHLWLHAQGG